MADQVDSMSDAELRTKLAEYGFPIMPITASTRKLLVKKLKLVLDNKSKPRNNADTKADNRRSLAKYSSGEDSDLDTNSTRDKKIRRATAGGAMLPPLGARTRRATPKKEYSPVKVDDKESESEEEKRSPVKTREEVETVTTRRVTRMFKGNNDHDDYETGSDSDVDMEKSTSSPFRSSSRSSDYISSTLPAAEVLRPSPPKTSFFSRPSVASSAFGPGQTASESLNSIRSRLGLSSAYSENSPAINSGLTSTYSSTFKPSNMTSDSVDSPYLSDFTRRLTALKPHPPKPTPFVDRDVNNGNTSFTRRSYVTQARPDPLDYKSGDKKFLKSNLVSLALVGIVALFFFCLFFMYLVKKNDVTSIVDDKNSVIPICQLNIPGNRPGINCVPKEQVSYAKDLLRVIRPELTARAASFKCGQPNVMPYLTDREILDLASSRAAHDDMNQFRADLNNLQVLILSNQRWGLSVVVLKNIYTKNAEHNALSTMDEVVRQRNKGSVAIAVTDPATPVSCLLLNALYSAGSTITVLALLAVVTFGIHKIAKFYIIYRKQRNEEIYSMVEQIIEIISVETEESGESVISVDHVRDTLILPQNREKLASIWNAAVNFIQRNESRVRLEVQPVDGEECNVWRWTSAHGSPRRNTAWQGQAFETQEGSVNNLAVSPTPCLKIRHMFDKNDTNPDLKTVIQDAILDKCDRCKILHIDLDRSSCCVYVKCASPKDAGIVYKGLHGWWYEGKLITVKYLRLERYMVRFPNCPSTGPYLTPSNQRHSAWDE